MQAPTSPNRPTLGFILLIGSLTAFGAFSIDLYLPALPAIAQDFKTDIANAQLTMASFLAGMAIGQLAFGPLSDRYGRRPPLLAGILIYTLASLFLLFAPSIESLTIGRFIQGLGACAGTVIARAIVRDKFDTTESARLFSLTFLVLAVAPMLAPTTGALLMKFFGWHSIFLLLTVFGVLIGLASFFGLPESRTEATQALANSESAWASYVAALKDKKVLGFVTAGALNGAALFTFVAGSPALFMEYYGQSASDFGILFGLNCTGLIVSSQVNRAMLKRYGPAKVARSGATAAFIFAFMMVASALLGFASMYIVLGFLFLCLASYGFVSANSTALALGAMPQRAGAISALVGCGSFAFGAIAGAATAPFAAKGPMTMALAMATGFAGSAYALWKVTRA